MSTATHVQPRPRRALLVEPHDDTRNLYRAYFQLARWRVEEAEDGRVALAVALTAPPDVIVSEARLPGLSGLDLCRELRADPATSQVPIVLILSDSQPSMRELALRSGADRVLVKPCLPEALEDELQRLTARTPLPAPPARVFTRATPHREPLPSPEGAKRRQTLVRAHQRQVTTTPPLAPPALVCPACDMRLSYLKSHVGGVSALHQEQWDYFRCPSGCGDFQYRHRTRRLRRL